VSHIKEIQSITSRFVLVLPPVLSDQHPAENDIVAERNTSTLTMLMDVQDLRDRVSQVAQKRAFLVKLSLDPQIGNLSLDVNQALTEMDDLLAEYARTFPNERIEDS
jgi:hypothetical protein